MTDQTKNQNDQPAVDNVEQVGDALGRLMAGKVPAPPTAAATDQRVHAMEAKALAAARAALSQDAAPDPGTQSEVLPAPAALLTPSLRRRLLQVMLVLNLALMGVLLALPSGTVSTTVDERSNERAAPLDQANAGPQRDSSPFVQAPRIRALEVPEREMFNRALQLSNDGRFSEAISVLEQYLTRNPGMIPPLKRSVLLAISQYHARNNDLAAADRYATMASQLAARASLPDDLLAAAEQAEREGRMSDMRAAYARFLLQQRQIRGDLRRHAAESYLKLADSWRSEAEQAQDKADADARSQQQRIRDELRKEGVGR